MILLSKMAVNKALEKKAREDEEARLVAEAEEVAEKADTKKATTIPDAVSEIATDEESSAEPEEETEVKILYFWDPDCGACMIATPIMREIEGEGIILISWFNVDETPGYIGQYRIVQTPTYIVNGHKSHYPEEYPFTKEEIYNYWNTYK